MLAIIMVCVFLLCTCKAVNDHDSSNKDVIFPVLLCNAAFRKFIWQENEAMNVWTVSQSKGPVLVSICYAYSNQGWRKYYSHYIPWLDRFRGV